MIFRHVLKYKKLLLFLRGFLDNYLQWILRECKSHSIYKYVSAQLMSVLRFDRVMTLRTSASFEANCSNQTLRFLKHLNCLPELCVTAAAAAPTADRVRKWDKSMGQIQQLPVALRTPACTCSGWTLPTKLRVCFYIIRYTEKLNLTSHKPEPTL